MEQQLEESLVIKENPVKPVEFDWSTYASTGGNRLTINPKIRVKNPKDKVYCHEPYAQKMYDAMFGNGESENIQKDLNDGAIYEIVVSAKASGNELIGTVIGSMQSVFINVEKEKNFLKSINYDVEFTPGTKATVLVTKSKDGSSYFGSIEKGYKLKLRKELMDSLKDRKSAYMVEILEINSGGFIVNLSGLRCFMPGSLAAANKIQDDQFESMIGKNVYVMVESYLDSSDMFVVSNKRYIKTILPQKVKELDYNVKYKGKITGSAPYGCFVEWDEIFTGLIHSSEMDPDLAVRIKKSKPGEEVEFWIKEIKDSNRIILSQKGPDGERIRYKEFKEKWEDQEFGGARIKDIKDFGVFVELEEGIIGMLPPREFKKFGRKVEGDEIDVYIKSVDAMEKKIYLRNIED